MCWIGEKRKDGNTKTIRADGEQAKSAFSQDDYSSRLRPCNIMLILRRNNELPVLFRNAERRRVHPVKRPCSADTMGIIRRSRTDFCGSLDRLRQINSNLEGHPTASNPLVKIATGSLGQGLSTGVGMALGNF